MAVVFANVGNMCRAPDQCELRRAPQYFRNAHIRPHKLLAERKTSQQFSVATEVVRGMAVGPSRLFPRGEPAARWPSPSHVGLPPYRCLPRWLEGRQSERRSAQVIREVRLVTPSLGSAWWRSRFRFLLSNLVASQTGCPKQEKSPNSRLPIWG